tara:strand:- start:1162 stop:1482 length:321 start_codon:yes stop_codon:yes gene_type:complete
MMIKKINISIFIFLVYTSIYSNKLINGTIIDCKTNLPLPGVEITFDENSSNNEPILSNFDGYFELEVSENIKEIFIRYPKYKELKITIGENNNLGEITLLKRGCKK